MLAVILYLFVLAFRVQINNAICSGPLGLSTGEIKDWQITASSVDEKRKEFCQASFVRLFPNHLDQAWCPRTSQSHQWIQVDFGTPTKLHGLMTQGRIGSNEWITAFLISYSLDYFHWDYITDNEGNQNVFTGNHDSVSIRFQYFRTTFTTRFIRFHVVSWNVQPSLRLEFVGCQECNKPLVNPPYSRFTASSTVPTRHRATCQARDAFLLNNKGWCARFRQVKDNWLQIDLSHPTRVTALVTKGRGDRGEQWVTKYIIAFSNDTRLWVYYNDAQRIEPKIFSGNFDRSLERIHYLNLPFTARFVRFIPKEWNNRLSMRAGLLGCPHKGLCALGYFRVQPDTPCVENLAHRKEISVHNLIPLSHYPPSPSFLSYLIDGYDVPTRCATIDSNRFRNNEPHLTIDLNRYVFVQGVIIQQLDTFSHLSQDDYNARFQLDRIDVYVTREAFIDNIRLEESRCSYLTRNSQTIRSSRLHLQCPTPTLGRFIHLRLFAVRMAFNRTEQRFALPFKAYFCEIYAYN